MFVSIIIINYDTFQTTCNCLQSVLQHTKGVPYEIILVDNASPHDNPDEFLVRFPGITLIKCKENGGFSKGNNIGLREAQGDIFLLLNSDTVLIEDSISIAALRLKQLPNAGAVGVRLTYEDGKLQHTARKFRSIKNELLDLIRPALMLMPYKKRAALMLNQYFHGDYDTQADWVSGAFMMFPEKVIDDLRGRKLDERFFMYAEDELWCYQFMEQGYKNYFLSSTTVIHIHGGSTKPAQQLGLLKTILKCELEIMKYRKGKGLYYYTFRCIFVTKEMLRYYVKAIAYHLFKYRIR